MCIRDSYNPDESLHACIILIMPQIVAPWNVTYNNELETRFNNNVQTTNELIEVLDPNGQVLTKSPYTQTGSSFSQSINTKSFRGGMFVDGFAGNVETRIVAITNAFQLDIASLAGTGLFLRKPQMPAPFYINGARYQVAAITNYDQSAGTATIRLASSSNGGNGYTGSTPYAIIIQTAGNRSLLADPRGDDIKDKVNQIKKRQKFRPFAPCVLEEKVNDWFNPGIVTPYMQHVVQSRTNTQKQLPAVIHKDGSCRVQTIHKDEPTIFRRVIEIFHQKTGVPVLLNTSLNIRGEPMVNGINDAIRFEEKYGVKVFY